MWSRKDLCELFWPTEKLVCKIELCNDTVWYSMFAFFKSFLNFKVSKKCLEETISYSLQLTIASTTNGSQLHDRNFRIC